MIKIPLKNVCVCVCVDIDENRIYISAQQFSGS